MKTKAISVRTTYEANGCLRKAVDAKTRKECFDIFVEHLDGVGHKKKKKKDKDKVPCLQHLLVHDLTH
ncbi:unnamed protein product [Durusdinium trenchii]|uniref:Uncharacterized protein n=1 Tax=Durusdinium trenchii TaxID=1381693 RepID=A0ABP0JGM1_9DINO